MSVLDRIQADECADPAATGAVMPVEADSGFRVDAVAATGVLERETVGVRETVGSGHRPQVGLGRGVVDLVRRLGECAITVELTLDFEGLVTKQAVAFAGESPASLGFRCVRVDGVDVWWRQRLLLAEGRSRLSTDVRPRRVEVRRIGRALSASADYA